MKDYKWEMHPDTIFEAKRMTNGKLVRGQVVGAEPFIYILTKENYDASCTTTGNERGECKAEMRLIRVIGHTVRQVDRFARDISQEDKNDTLFGVGDIVRGKCKNGFAFDGRIFHVDIKKEGDKLHPVMFITQLEDSQVPEFGHTAVWIDQISELDIVRFKEET